MQTAMSPTFLSNKYFVITILALNYTIQQAIANGFPAILTRTLELRFNLSSDQSGFLNSCYEIAEVFAAVFIINLLQDFRKTFSIGFGLFLAGIGGVIFAVPHYFEDAPDAPDHAPDASTSQTSSTNTWSITFLALGLLIVGLGSVPTHVFVPTFLSENFTKQESSLYLSIIYAIGIIGPVIGVIVGGEMLNWDTNFDKEEKFNGDLSPEDGGFVGAWWPGMLGAGVLICFTSLVVLFLPYKLPTRTNKNKKKKKIQIGQFGQNSTSFIKEARSKSAQLIKSTQKYTSTLYDSVNYLFRNKVWLLTSIYVTSEAFAGQIMVAFAAKYISVAFYTSQSIAAMIVGVMALSGAVLGYLLSGCWLRYKNVNSSSNNFGSNLKNSEENLSYLSTESASVSSNLSIPSNVSLTKSPMKFPELQNITLQQQEKASNPNNLQATDLNLLVNTTFVGVVVTIFTSFSFFFYCQEGQREVHVQQNEINITITSSNLIANQISSNPTCQNSTIITWAFINFLGILSISWNIVPAVQLFIRGVDQKYTSQSLAFQTVFSKLIGSVPAPIIFGYFMDLSCLRWNGNTDTAQKSRSSGSCQKYDIASLAMTFLMMFEITRLFGLMSIICLKMHVVKLLK